MRSKSDKNAFKSKGLFAAMLGRSLKGGINFYTQIWEENLHFRDSGAQNQLNFEAVLERKLCLRDLPRGLHDSYGTL